MDFDKQQRKRHKERDDEFGDVKFTLRGETFNVRSHIPFAALRELTNINRSSTDKDAFEAVEYVVNAILRDPADRDRFKKVIYNIDSEFPVTFEDMLEIRDWLLAEASGRPPTQPESSSESPSTNGNSETARSSSEPAAA